MTVQSLKVGHEGIGSRSRLHKWVMTVQSLKVGHEKVGQWPGVGNIQDVGQVVELVRQK